MTHHDRTPIEALRAGDVSALEGLLDQHWTGLLRYAHGFVRDWDQAEDVVQTAYVRLWARRARWTSGSAAALLHRIVRNQALDVVKASRFRDGADGLESREGADRPDREVEAKELSTAASAAVAALPERRREVYRLGRESGLTYAEIGEVMGLAPQTVANHMSLALADLRKALRPYLDASDGAPPESGNEGPPTEATEG